MATDAAVQIPGNAISQDADVQGPVVSLLQALSLLGTPQQLQEAGSAVAAITGPPQSVAVIEAGATAATKWWATGFGVSAVAAWARILTWWGGQPDGIKAVALGGGFLITAVAIASIGYLFASDVRGRAAATVATVQARQNLAEAMLDAAETASQNRVTAAAEPATETTTQWLQLSPPLPVRNIRKAADDEAGWKAIAVGVAANGGKRQYLVVKGSDEAVLEPGDLGFD